jgi:hypothetical protein
VNYRAYYDLSWFSPSLKVIPYVQRFDIEDGQLLQWGEQRAQEVHVVKGENDLVPSV